MSRDQRVLERHFRHWREKRLLTPEQEDALRRASGELAQGHASTAVKAALGVLGGGLLLVGLVLLVAENWGAIPRFVKLGSWGALQCAFLLLAHDLSRRLPERPYLAEAFAGVAGGWVLGGIALVSQIYHLNSRPPNGIWLWLALVLPAAWLLKHRATAGVLFVALTTALALEVATDDSWLHARNSDNPWLFLAIPLLTAVLVSWLPCKVASLPEWVGVWIFGVSNFFLLVFGATEEFHRPALALGGAWLLAAAGMALALAFPVRCLPRAWDCLTARAVPALTLLPWIVLGSEYDRGSAVDVSARGLSWVIQLALPVLVIRGAARVGSGAWVNLAYLALLAGILTRYFDFFGDYLEGGTALVATGALLLFVLYALERARRRTLKKEVVA